ncbi:MAG: hypothetical protein JSS81_11390 [Acidobacteria bacterium]|nr:hypothetical protein [Acidobacteriota bacterium]
MKYRAVFGVFIVLLIALLTLGAGNVPAQSSKKSRAKKTDLCARLALIKALPYEEGETGVDPEYDALYRAGEAAGFAVK